MKTCQNVYSVAPEACELIASDQCVPDYAEKASWSKPCQFKLDGSPAPEFSKHILALKNKNAEKIDHKYSFVAGSMASKQGMAPTTLEAPEGWKLDVEGCGFDMCASMSEWHCKPFVVVAKLFAFKWECQCWPFSGISCLVVGLKYTCMVSLLPLQVLIDAGLDCMVNLPMFFADKNSEHFKHVLHHEDFRTSVLGPGDALWVPFGYMPLFTTMVLKDDFDGDEKAAALVFPFYDLALSRKATDRVKGEIYQNIERTFMMFGHMKFAKPMREPVLRWARQWCPRDSDLPSNGPAA